MEHAMLAFTNTTHTKDEVLAQIRAHALADEIVKGQYWEGGRGCAVGCTLHSDNHAEYEPRFGIPQMLARLEDCIFEGLPNKTAKVWPERFMLAIRPGVDLSLVGWKFLHWLLTDETVNPGITYPSVKSVVKRCADLLLPLTKGEKADSSAAMDAALDAAMDAASAAKGAESVESAESAESAECAARSAESAAWSGQSAASSAESAAWSARSAERAAWSAESAAWNAECAARSAESAAWSARSARHAAGSAESAAWNAERGARAWNAERARSATYLKMADKLIELIEAAWPTK